MLNAQCSMLNVILVRHGRTTYNEQGRYQGSSDRSILTAKGHQNAYATGIALQQFNFDAVYTSPLKRVQQTTQEIIAAFNSVQKQPPVFIEPKLTEIYMSDWEGLTYQEVKDTFAEDYDCWQSTPHLFTRDGVDYPVLNLYQQARIFWQQILIKHRQGTVLVVAHGGTNKALISTAIAIEPQYYHFLQQSNCGISNLQFTNGYNVAQLKYLNSTNHLEEFLPKLKAGKKGVRLLLVNNNTSLIDLENFFSSKISQQQLNFVLTDEANLSEYLANQLFQHNSALKRLSITKDMFLNNWQEILLQQQLIADKQQKLLTGILLLERKTIAQIINQKFNSQLVFSLENYLTVIHYPDQESHLILQGILPFDSL